MTSVTRNTRNCEYCNEPFTPTPGPMAAKQRFCCTKHRVYASREGVGPNIAQRSTSDADTDTTIAAAICAAEAFTPIIIADTKTVAAIKVERKRADPSSWSVTVPSGSILAAGKIHQALADRIGDLITLANLLAQPAGEPRLILQTRGRKR